MQHVYELSRRQGRLNLHRLQHAFGCIPHVTRVSENNAACMRKPWCVACAGSWRVHAPRMPETQGMRRSHALGAGSRSPHHTHDSLHAPRYTAGEPSCISNNEASSVHRSARTMVSLVHGIQHVRLTQSLEEFIIINRRNTHLQSLAHDRWGALVGLQLVQQRARITLCN